MKTQNAVTLSMKISLVCNMLVRFLILLKSISMSITLSINAVNIDLSQISYRSTSKNSHRNGITKEIPFALASLKS